MDRATIYECARCGTDFPMAKPHTEIVRRDFVEVPQPSCIERLGYDCWEAYITEFLGDEFAELMNTYRA